MSTESKLETFIKTDGGRAEWTPVGERLPERRIRVLVWDGLIISDCYYGHGRLNQPEECWRQSCTDDPCRYTVTHWTSLPASPAQQASSTAARSPVRVLVFMADGKLSSVHADADVSLLIEHEFSYSDDGKRLFERSEHQGPAPSGFEIAWANAEADGKSLEADEDDTSVDRQ